MIKKTAYSSNFPLKIYSDRKSDVFPFYSDLDWVEKPKWEFTETIKTFDRKYLFLYYFCLTF